jgi:hypothetical protein
MDTGTLLTIAGLVIGATWALRSKLGDIEKALSAHVASDTQQFRALDARVTRLENQDDGR